jgi:hypothetical protein
MPTLALCRGIASEVNPFHPWRLVEDADHLDVIYDWEPDKFGALSRDLERAGCFVFGSKRTSASSQ